MYYQRYFPWIGAMWSYIHLKKKFEYPLLRTYSFLKYRQRNTKHNSVHAENILLD